MDDKIKKAQKQAWYGFALVIVGVLFAIIVLVAGGLNNATSAIGFVVSLIALILGLVIVFLSNKKVKELRGGR